MWAFISAKLANHDGSYGYIKAVGVWAIYLRVCICLRACAGTCFPLCNFFANYFLNTQLGPNSICGFLLNPNVPSGMHFGMPNDDARSCGGLATKFKFVST